MPWGMKNKVISLWGSSIIEGRIGVDDPMDRWYNLMHTRLSRKFPETCFPIVNGAVGGESFREIMSRFDRDLLAYNPDFCFLMFGWNNDDYGHPSRILRPGELDSLLDSFVRRIPAKTRIIGVINGPVIDRFHAWTTDPAFHDYLANFGGSLNRAAEVERVKGRAFFRAREWPFIDLYELMKADPEKYILLSDGIHLSPEGHRVFASAASAAMEKLFGGASRT